MESEWKNIWVIQTKNFDGNWVSITDGEKIVKLKNKEWAERIRDSFIEKYGINPKDIRIQVIITSE